MCPQVLTGTKRAGLFAAEAVSPRSLSRLAEGAACGRSSFTGAGSFRNALPRVSHLVDAGNPAGEGCLAATSWETMVYAHAAEDEHFSKALE